MPETAQTIIARSQPDTTAVALEAGTARWSADLAQAAGGAGEAPTPHELLDSALAACTLLTLQLYAKRKQYPLASAEVRVLRDESAEVYKLHRQVTVHGDLDEKQRADLLRVANACPIHKALEKRFEITTALDA
ncbi:OsmC family protein [Ramlibacter sp. G-1-2-2]|uniref:OsmC family protein n=1 Tax=Ramlibacter agri TaxID=2728837 RepID=A0A848H1X4_9BURK|nr:OsmC family protein [Ramlibacter agri]NML44564.1 OsmC family protein [Ramlibacter agri]